MATFAETRELIAEQFQATNQALAEKIRKAADSDALNTLLEGSETAIDALSDEAKNTLQDLKNALNGTGTGAESNTGQAVEAAGDWVKDNGGFDNIAFAVLGGLGIMSVFNKAKRWITDEESQSFGGKVFGGLLSVAALAGGVFALLKTNAGSKSFNAVGDWLDGDSLERKLNDDGKGMTFSAGEGHSLNDAGEKQAIIDAIEAAGIEAGKYRFSSDNESITFDEGTPSSGVMSALKKAAKEGTAPSPAGS